MDRIYDVLTTLPKDELIARIVQTYADQSTLFLHFLYFAAAEMNGLYKDMDSAYAQELLQADYLLPDGIALRLLHFARLHPELPGWKILLQYPKYSRLAIENKNGTDFAPEVIRALPKDTRIVMYGTTPVGMGPALVYARAQFGRVTT